MKNPYLIDLPAVFKFSGGRTSGYMLRQTIDAFGGTLPDDLKVVFNNTGKERTETLDFVERCGQQWGVPITWLEYRYDGSNHSFEVVDYGSASRNGEPFEQVIQHRGVLPNPRMRFCSGELKDRTTVRYLKSVGWDHWTVAIGFRYDEPARLAKARKNAHKDEDLAFPLFDAKVVKETIQGWWRQNDFDLGLDDHEGNCDLCFLKNPAKIRRIMSARPELAAWRVNMEDKAAKFDCGASTKVFRMDRASYKGQLAQSKYPTMLDVLESDDELSISCNCTD